MSGSPCSHFENLCVFSTLRLKLVDHVLVNKTVSYHLWNIHLLSVHMVCVLFFFFFHELLFWCFEVIHQLLSSLCFDRSVLMCLRVGRTATERHYLWEMNTFSRGWQEVVTSLSFVSNEKPSFFQIKLEHSSGFYAFKRKIEWVAAWSLMNRLICVFLFWFFQCEDKKHVKIGLWPE